MASLVRNLSWLQLAQSRGGRTRRVRDDRSRGSWGDAGPGRRRQPMPGPTRRRCRARCDRSSTTWASRRRAQRGPQESGRDPDAAGPGGGPPRRTGRRPAECPGRRRTSQPCRRAQPCVRIRDPRRVHGLPPRSDRAAVRGPPVTVGLGSAPRTRTAGGSRATSCCRAAAGGETASRAAPTAAGGEGDQLLERFNQAAGPPRT